MLREYGLPVSGDRSIWELRHQQYVYNLASLCFYLFFFYISTWIVDG